MPRYDANLFAPPAPLARVTLRSGEKGTQVTDVPMLLDNGADVSMVPRFSAEKLAVSAMPVESFKLLGFDGSASVASAVHLEMIFCGRSFRGQYLLIDQEWGILGRNILNLLPILYDGPRLTWTLQRTNGAVSRAT